MRGLSDTDTPEDRHQHGASVSTTAPLAIHLHSPNWSLMSRAQTRFCRYLCSCHDWPCDFIAHMCVCVCVCIYIYTHTHTLIAYSDIRTFALFFPVTTHIPTKFLSPSQPSGHYMYRPLVTICTTSLTFNNSTFRLHGVFMCFVWI